MSERVNSQLEFDIDYSEPEVNDRVLYISPYSHFTRKRGVVREIHGRIAFVEFDGTECGEIMCYLSSLQKLTLTGAGSGMKADDYKRTLEEALKERENIEKMTDADCELRRINKDALIEHYDSEIERLREMI